MFTKKPDRDIAVTDPSRSGFGINTVRPVSAPPQLPVAGPALGRAASATPTVIGADLTITGNLQSKGEVQIDGEIQGDIRALHVVIGEHAHITGGIVAEDVIVRGHVMGSIRGNKITLQSTSRVEGDVFHKSLAIEQGAYFEGKSRRSEDPMADAAGPESVPLPATDGHLQ